MGRGGGGTGELRGFEKRVAETHETHADGVGAEQ